MVVAWVVAATGEEDDPVLSLRLGPDVLLVEIDDSVPRPEIGEAIAVRVPSLELYPYQL